jgi:hypothetical protein
MKRERSKDKEKNDRLSTTEAARVLSALDLKEQMCRQDPPYSQMNLWALFHRRRAEWTMFTNMHTMLVFLIALKLILSWEGIHSAFVRYIEYGSVVCVPLLLLLIEMLWHSSLLLDRIFYYSASVSDEDEEGRRQNQFTSIILVRISGHGSVLTITQERGKNLSKREHLRWRHLL